MKTSFTKKLSLLLFFSLLISSTQLLKAQMLEEIPNPTPLTLDFFTGGENNSLFFNYVDFNFNATLHHYDGDDLSEVILPPDSQFSSFSHQYNGKSYIISFDGAFVSALFEYDGVSTNQIELPPGFEFGFYVANYDDKMYIVLYDPGFNAFLYQYDGTTLEEVPSPMGLQFDNYITTIDDVMFLTFFDPINFTSSLYSFDGNTLFEVPNLPLNTSFVFLAFEGENNLYLGIQDATFNTTLYAFNGIDFTEITAPANMDFSFVVGENIEANEVYISYFDNMTFNNSLFVFDAFGGLTEISSPPGFDFPNLANIHNGITYFSYFDNINFTNSLFRYQSGLLDEVESPLGSQYSFYADTLLGEAYYLYFDASFNQILTKLDQNSNSINEVEGPVNFNFNQYATTVGDKMFLIYNDPVFDRSLWIFDGQEFVQIENPIDKTFGNFMVEDNGKIYLRYNDIDFNGTLYVLTPNSLPTSIDTSVTTYKNVPYFFSSDDFSFADTDPDDIFTNILITEIEQVGYLLWDGAHVYEGDIIPFDEIENMTFTPLTDDLGSPYDTFRFKVGDGEAFSDLSYTMTINVLDPTAVTDNELNAFTKLFPIPANTSTTLSITTEKSLDELSLRIFSTSGQIVFQNSYNGLSNQFIQNIDVSQLPSGSYILVGKTALGQFVKQIQISR